MDLPSTTFRSIVDCLNGRKLNLLKPVKSGAGFTLIELLATMIVVLTVGAVMGGILFSAVRSNNKASTLTTVKQNGTYAISQMSKMIRYAKSFDGVTTDATSGSPVYTTDCVQPTVAPLTPTPTPVAYKRVKITSFDGGSSTFWCESVGVSPATISSNSASLVDTTAILVNTCSFACTQASINDPPVISIDFNLRQRKSTLFAEQQSKLDFHTSVAFRNWSR